MDARALVQQLREEIPGCAGVAVGTLDGSAYFGDGSLTLLRDPLREVARAWHATHLAAGGAVAPGDPDEVLTSASRSHLLLKVQHRERWFVAVMLHVAGDLAALRSRLRAFLRRAVA